MHKKHHGNLHLTLQQHAQAWHPSFHIHQVCRGGRLLQDLGTAYWIMPHKWQ